MTPTDPQTPCPKCGGIHIDAESHRKAIRACLKEKKVQAAEETTAKLVAELRKPYGHPPLEVLCEAASRLEEQERQLAVARNAIALIEHARELGYLGEGSTKGWADDVSREARAAGLGAP